MKLVIGSWTLFGTVGTVGVEVIGGTAAAMAAAIAAVFVIGVYVGGRRVVER